jgi:cytochrome b involved in lipid metabolism
MIKKISISLCILLLSFISFGYYLKYSPFAYPDTQVEYNEKIGMWHKRNFSGVIAEECYRNSYEFDEEGMLKQDYGYDSKKKDVIVLGDSYLESLMLKSENRIHNVLARIFDQKYNFLNYALAGSSPIEQFVILKERANLHTAKYVLHVVALKSALKGVNSVNLTPLNRPKVYLDFTTVDEYTLIPPEKKNLVSQIGDTLSGFGAYYFMVKSLYFFRDLIKEHKKKSDKSNKHNQPKNWLQLKGAIYQTHKYIKSHGAEYKVIISSKYKENGKTFAQFLDSLDIDYILLDKYVAEKKLQLEGFSCDDHWNGETLLNISKLVKKASLIS